MDKELKELKELVRDTVLSWAGKMLAKGRKNWKPEDFEIFRRFMYPIK